MTKSDTPDIFYTQAPPLDHKLDIPSTSSSTTEDMASPQQDDVVQSPVADRVKYFADLTTAHGAKRILVARSRISKLCWFLLIVAFFLILFYLVIQLVQKWKKHDRITSISMKFDEVEFPAITFCNLNPYKRSLVRMVPSVRDTMDVYDNAKSHSKTKNEKQPKFKRKQHVEMSQKLVRELFRKEIEEEEQRLVASGLSLPPTSATRMFVEDMDDENILLGREKRQAMQPHQIYEAIEAHCRCIGKLDMECIRFESPPRNENSKCICTMNLDMDKAWPCFNISIWYDHLCPMCSVEGTCEAEIVGGPTLSPSLLAEAPEEGFPCACRNRSVHYEDNSGGKNKRPYCIRKHSPVEMRKLWTNSTMAPYTTTTTTTTEEPTTTTEEPTTTTTPSTSMTTTTSTTTTTPTTTTTTPTTTITTPTTTTTTPEPTTTTTTPTTTTTTPSTTTTTTTPDPTTTSSTTSTSTTTTSTTTTTKAPTTTPSTTTTSTSTTTTTTEAPTTTKSTTSEPATEPQRRPDHHQRPIVTNPETIKAMGFSGMTDGVAMLTKAKENLMFTMAALSVQQRVALSQAKREFIEMCSFNGKECDIDQDFRLHVDPEFGNCYTFNYDVTNNYTSSRAGPMYGIRVLLFVNTTDYMSTSESSGVRLAIHPPTEYPFPDTFGYSAPVGFASSFGIRKQKVERLPGYGDCQENSEAITADYIYTGYDYHPEGCHRSCFQNRMIKDCACGDPRFPVPPGMKHCSAFNATARNCLEAHIGASGDFHHITADMENCVCKHSCSEEVYSMAFSTSKWPSGATDLGDCDGMTEQECEHYYRMNAAMVEVYYEQLNYELLQESEAYGFVNLLADFGGHLGLWMGFSVITIVECVALGFDILKTYCSPKRHRKEEEEEKLKKEPAKIVA